MALTGLDIEAKARLIEEAFWLACPFSPGDFDSVTTKLNRTDKVDPATNEEAVATWRLTLKDHDERKVGRAVADVVVEMALATIPGFFTLGFSLSSGSAFGVYRPAVVARELVPQYVTVLGGSRAVVDSLAPSAHRDIVVDDELRDEPASGPTTWAPLGELFGARSGDKGGHANLGIYARSDAAWSWLDDFLSVEQLQRLLPETASLVIDRYRLPTLRSLNFVIHNLLDEGVAAATRQDAQAKSLGEWLRSRYVEIPSVLLTSL